MSNDFDITIEYVDEIKCKILAKKEILYSLRNAFSFFADGYKFNQKYRSGIWDGKINMIDYKGIFPSGILKRVLRHCKEQGLKIKVNEIWRYKDVEVSPNLIQTLCSYCKFEPYDYQQTAVLKVLSKKKMLMLSPTSSGKSLMIYMLYRWAVDNNMPMLITVPSTSLAEQLISDFREYVADDHDVDKYVATLYSGKDKGTQKLVVISTWQTCSNMPEEWIKKFRFYIADEAHGTRSEEQTKIINHMTECEYRNGFTGTLNGAEMHELEMNARFGDIYQTITTRELIDRGIVTDILINAIKLKYDEETVKNFHTYSQGDYQKEIDFICDLQCRNDYIVNHALNLDGNTLMLFNFIERHGDALLSMLKEKELQYKKKTLYVSGKVKTKERETIRKQMDSDLPKYYDIHLSSGGYITVDEETAKSIDINSYIGKKIDIENSGYDYYLYGDISGIVDNIKIVDGSYILLATYGTLSTGINIRNLHHLIFCHAYKGKIRILQSIGRILRKSKVKNKVYLHDLIDDFRKGRKVNHTYKHGEIRLEVYEQEEFDYEIRTESI